MPPLTRRGSILCFSTSKAALGEQRAELGDAGELRHGLAQVGADLPGGAFRRLQRDVAGKALDDHDVDDALADLVALDEAAIVERQAELGLLQPGVRLLDLLVALDLLDADVEQADASAARCGTARAPWRRPSARSRPAGAPRRRCWRRRRARSQSPLDGRPLARRAPAARCPASAAGISATSPSARRCCRPRWRRPPRRFCTASSASHMLDALAAAQRLARLVVHGDGGVGVHDASMPRRGPGAPQARARYDLRSPQKMKRMPGWVSSAHGCPRYDDRRSMVASHRIDRDCARLRHMFLI